MALFSRARGRMAITSDIGLGPSDTCLEPSNPDTERGLEDDSLGVS
jgi:hypothetical protein